MMLRCGVRFLFTAAADLATFAASFARLFGREAVAAAALVRGPAAFAGDTALLLGRHGGEATAAFLADAVGRAEGTFGVGGRSSGRGWGSCHRE